MSRDSISIQLLLGNCFLSFFFFATKLQFHGSLWWCAFVEAAGLLFHWPSFVAFCLVTLSLERVLFPSGLVHLGFLIKAKAGHAQRSDM
jgi:hypothetical protein